MTFKEAIQAHELDVAAFDLKTPQKQFENLQKWVGKIKPGRDMELADKLLAGFAKRYRLKLEAAR